MSTATDKPKKHLDSLTIKNFRILEDVEIKKLGHVNLIVGKNNSGKSTVLEALALFSSGFNPETIKFITDSREIFRYIDTYENVGNTYSINSFFNLDESKPIYQKIYIGDDRRFLEFGYTNSSDQNYDDRKSGDQEFTYFIDDLNMLEVLATSNFKLVNSMLENPTKNDKEKLIYSYITTNKININKLANAWDEIALTSNEDLVIEILQLIIPDIKNVAFLSDNKSKYRIPFVRLKNKEKKLRLHEMGDGIIRLLQIILQAIHARHGFLLIDEVENGLHYSVQAEVWRLIFELAERFNIQVFATTHSWDCIESFAQVAKEREDLDGVLFRMGRSARKSDKGKVIATVYDEDELYYITKSQMEVR